MRFAVDIGSKKVAINCHKALRAQAKWVLTYLKETFAEKPEKLKDGYKLQMGWTVFCLKGSDADLVLCEPAYQGNPFTDWHTDLTTSLTVQAQQNDVLALTQADGVATLFQDKIVLAKGCLAEPRVYLYRSKAASPGDSGWYIAPVAKGSKEPVLEAIFAYELLKHRRALLQVLPLPPGYMVIFNGDVIEAWRGENGQ
jgi:hypothetical protein